MMPKANGALPGSLEAGEAQAEGDVPRPEAAEDGKAGVGARRRSLGAIKPFQLVKYLSLSSLVVILVCTILLSLFISHRAKAILLRKSEQYALLLAENLNHQVFFQFTLPTLIADGEIKLSRQSQYERLDRVVRNTIHGFSIERVNIYDPTQTLTYSTDQGMMGMAGDLGAPFQRALGEETVSVIQGDGYPFWGFARQDPKQLLVTYLPMWEERTLSWKRGKILGVFEITQDVTADYKTIHRFQWIVVSGFLLFVGVLFLTISLIARRAESIIRARSRERQRLEEQLHQSERLAALGEMIAGVSHEIRNPLGIIRSTAELLHGRIEHERQRRFTSIIVEEATRLNDILTEFLDFARPKTPRAKPCRIEDIIERNLSAMEGQLQRASIQVERFYEAGDYVMEADGDLLYRAFVNLLANAVQAMPDGGTLRVRTIFRGSAGSPPQIELRIRDTGPGISEEVQKKIFNPFFTTREKGTGLGLAIVRSIIDSHGGEIEVRSRPDKGTNVIIRLPLNQVREE
ncbi:MAG: ATP-binding protein [Syntrophobacteraceae bacterium]|jgi:signal transduction histidine kinase|nr:ATP-binding protein [Syntrophobacteraceae bacterium]